MLSNLSVSDQQRDIVQSVLHNPVTVASAGAGSGKTYTTVAAVLELLWPPVDGDDRPEVVRGAQIDRFALITFTNKAADELRAKLERALREQLVAAVDGGHAALAGHWRSQLERLSAAFVGTIHAFCARLLKQYGYEEGVPRDASVSPAKRLLGDALRDALEQEAATPYDPNAPLFDDRSPLEEFEVMRLARQVLAEARNRGLDLDLVVQNTGTSPNDQGRPYRIAFAHFVADVAGRYRVLKDAAPVLDQNDLLTRAADALEDDPGIPERAADRYRYLFVDEFQDTDRTQKRVVDALVGPNPGGRVLRTFVVGDTKQSIYEFRGADVSLIEELADGRGVPVRPLNASWRATAPFLDAQNALFTSIGQRPGSEGLNDPLARRPDPLVPQAGPPPIRYVDAGDEYTTKATSIAVTATALAQHIGQDIELVGHDDKIYHGPLLPGHVAVLTRSNKDAERYAEGLRAAGIPAQTERAESFYQREEVVATYRMLRLVLHYPDDTTLAIALRTPYLRDIAQTAAEKVQELIQARSEGPTPLLTWLTRDRRHPDLAERLVALRTLVRTETVPKLLRRLYDAFGIVAYYEERGDVRAVQNLERLRAIAREMFNNDQALTLRLFADALQQAILMDLDDPASQPDDDPLPDHVRVLTIHRSKGLEYPVVVIPETGADVLWTPDDGPDFLVDEVHGLELSIRVGFGDAAFNTRSQAYHAILGERRGSRLAEEMRILYVATTRAKNAVLFTGKGPRDGHPFPGNPPTPGAEYAWRDEILNAQASLVRAGAQIQR